MTTESTVSAPAVKIASAWAAVGITSWADAAAAVAFIYTSILILEWCWKKFARDWIKSRRRQ